MQSEKLSFREKLGYGLGDSASNFFFQVFNLFLLYYYTDVFGIAPAALSIMFFFTRAIDAASDPLMGLIADRTQTRWGKYRPYLLFGAIPYGICGFLMFLGPDLSDQGRLIYAYLTYTAMMLAYTVVNVPYSALMGVISPSSIERTKVSSYRFICAFAAGWLIATFVGPLKNLLGAGDETQGFRLTMALFAVCSIALFWVTFATTRERVQARPMKTNARENFRALLSNGPWAVLFASAIVTLMNIAVRNGSLLYYFKYYVGDDGTALFWIFDATAVFLSLGLVSMIGGIVLTKTLAEHFEKRMLMIVLTLLNAACMAAFFYIPADQYWLMVVVHCLGSFVIGPTPALVWSMYADCADYGEWKSGRRITALVFSTVLFAQKLGLAVGAGILSLVLSIFGFIANEAQSETSLMAIRSMFSLAPAALAILGAFFIFFYRISQDTIAQMEAELADLHDPVAAPA